MEIIMKLTFTITVIMVIGGIVLAVELDDELTNYKLVKTTVYVLLCCLASLVILFILNIWIR